MKTETEIFRERVFSLKYVKKTKFAQKELPQWQQTRFFWLAVASG